MSVTVDDALKLALRPARADDARMVFQWRNDPAIVRLGASNKTVTWEEHAEWFAATMEDGTRAMFIIERGGEPVGQVRFDRQDKDTCVVSIYLLEQHTGSGLGPPALRAACAEIFRNWNVGCILARIRHSNARSLAAFAKVGFESWKNRADDHPDLTVMALERPGGRSEDHGRKSV